MKNEYIEYDLGLLGKLILRPMTIEDMKRAFPDFGLVDNKPLKPFDSTTLLGYYGTMQSNQLDE